MCFGCVIASRSKFSSAWLLGKSLGIKHSAFFEKATAYCSSSAENCFVLLPVSELISSIRARHPTNPLRRYQENGQRSIRASSSPFSNTAHLYLLDIRCSAWPNLWKKTKSVRWMTKNLYQLFARHLPCRSEIVSWPSDGDHETMSHRIILCRHKHSRTKKEKFWICAKLSTWHRNRLWRRHENQRSSCATFDRVGVL